MTGLKACYHKTRNLFISFACTYAVIGFVQETAEAAALLPGWASAESPFNTAYPSLFPPEKSATRSIYCLFPFGYYTRSATKAHSELVPVAGH